MPIVVNGQTSRHTLTQTYFVTRLVEAVKTLPPMEQYEFIPTKAFTDFSNVLDEAGSEKREQLLPGIKYQHSTYLLLSYKNLLHSESDHDINTVFIKSQVNWNSVTKMIST